MYVVRVQRCQRMKVIFFGVGRAESRVASRHRVTHIVLTFEEEYELGYELRTIPIILVCSMYYRMIFPFVPLLPAFSHFVRGIRYE